MHGRAASRLWQQDAPREGWGGSSAATWLELAPLKCACTGLGEATSKNTLWRNMQRTAETFCFLTCPLCNHLWSTTLSVISTQFILKTILPFQVVVFALHKNSTMSFWYCLSQCHFVFPLLSFSHSPSLAHTAVCKWCHLWFSPWHHSSMSDEMTSWTLMITWVTTANQIQQYGNSAKKYKYQEEEPTASGIKGHGTAVE